jgi:hypothetical protein
MQLFRYELPPIIKEMQEKSPAGGYGGVPHPFFTSPKTGGYRGFTIIK